LINCLVLSLGGLRDIFIVL